MMGYARIVPSFWTGDTGRSIASCGPEALVVALYLMTSPHANMLGLYYLPRRFLEHETRLSPKGASKGLRWCIEADFCSYDDATQTVWVHEMAAHQVGPLKALDNRCAGFRKRYAGLQKSPFLGPFFDRYCDDFHLVDRRAFEGPSKPVTVAVAVAVEDPSQDGEFDRGIDAYTHTHASETVGTLRGAG
jgi:hypothetical protein